ncbi:S-adenosyl-L-methionine-dependent methyltransferase [Sporodiniella umbellata]|nr:S-adenosyl-L-methionine-dependent methyltransferase [Sporodiniella umbellata]
MDPEPLIKEREFYGEDSSTYWFPIDKDEHERLTGQHFILKDMLKGNVSLAARNILDFESGVSVLDIGCGSGAWLGHMNYDYPKGAYYGCDIIDSPDIVKNCFNLKFACGNVVGRLPFEDNFFDFVHMRLFVYALRAEEWPIAISEIIRVTKPRGVAQFVECSSMPPKDKSSKCYHLLSTMNDISAEKGQIPHITNKLEGMISANKEAEIVQKICVIGQTNDGSSIAKLLIWDIIKVAEGIAHIICPRLGLLNKDMAKYLTQLKADMLTNSLQIEILSLTIQKKK